MKKKLAFILFFIYLISTENIHSQTYVTVRRDTSMNYVAYQSIGSYFNGVKVGKWTDVTRDSVVYAESFYDSTGNPKGVWKINYSNGLLRREIEYNDHGICRWSLFRYNRKVGEAISDSVIPGDICWKLNAFETNLYDQEKTVRSSASTVNTGSELYHVFSYTRTDPFEEVLKIKDILVSNKFTGIFYVWNSDKTMRRKCTYDKGSEYRISYLYTKKKIVKKQDEYRDDKLVRTITFGGDGKEKIKNYKN